MIKKRKRKIRAKIVGREGKASMKVASGKTKRYFKGSGGGYS